MPPPDLTPEQLAHAEKLWTMSAHNSGVPRILIKGQWRIQTGFHSFRGNPLLADLKHERFIQWLLFSVVATS